jgi:hypothetical protein
VWSVIRIGGTVTHAGNILKLSGDTFNISAVQAVGLYVTLIVRWSVHIAYSLEHVTVHTAYSLEHVTLMSCWSYD